MNAKELIRELKKEFGTDRFAFPSGFHQFETALFQGQADVRTLAYNLGIEIRNYGTDKQIDFLFRGVNPNHNALNVVHHIADACLELRDKMLILLIVNNSGKFQREFVNVFRRAGVPLYPQPSGHMGMSPPTAQNVPPSIPLHQPIIVGPPGYPQGSPSGTAPPASPMTGPFAGRIRRGAKP